MKVCAAAAVTAAAAAALVPVELEGGLSRDALVL